MNVLLESVIPTVTAPIVMAALNAAAEVATQAME